MQKVIVYLLSNYLRLVNSISPRLGGKHAFLLFCYPFPLKFKKYQSDFLKTSHFSFLDFEGKRIAQYKWGSGEKVILCLHGWQSNSFKWKKYVEVLDKKKYTMICLDAPAHGRSDGVLFNVPMYARLIQQFLEQNKVDSILSHSLGAFSTMYLLSNYPLLSPPKVIALGTPSYADSFIDEFIRVLNLSSKARRNLVTYFTNYSGLKINDFDSKLFAKNQKSFGLIVHDINDKESPFEYAKEMAKIWPKSRFLGTEGFGHKLRDDSVVQEVIKFIDH
ncbi:MAG: alpha/beta hydrolase [Bacteroidia bacterium]|nr:alpha/beta hydrolase [Bacteroidia bacterium]